MNSSATQVQVFIPCFIDQLYPDTAVNMVRLLRKAGCEVDYNPKQTCCGQPAFNAGYWKQAQKVGEKWIKDLSQLDRPIVCPSSSCVGYVHNFMSDFDIQDPQIQELYARVQSQIFEFSEFVVKQLGVVDFGARLEGKAVYHDACAALRECRIYESPRQLLAQVEGLELLDMADADQCCGFGGTFAVMFEPISVAMAEKKVEAAVGAGADYLISADLSCLMHLQGYIDNKGLPIQTIHLVDVLAGGGFLPKNFFINLQF